MISGSSEFNKNKDNNKQGKNLYYSVQRGVCAAQCCAFQGQRNALQKCCASVARHLRVRVCVCVCMRPLMVNVKQQLLLLQVGGVLQCKCQANGDWQQSIGDWQLACAACCMLPAVCHLPLATCRATS